MLIGPKKRQTEEDIKKQLTIDIMILLHDESQKEHKAYQQDPHLQK